MNSPVLVSIQVAMPQRLGRKDATDPAERPWYTAFHKQPITGPVHVGKLTVTGDGQADPRFHGGPDRPILAYCAEHYDRWREELNEPAMPHGGFGENFTITALNEQKVCLGDQYAIGKLRVEVSQPRQPCSKLARRWQNNDLPALVIRHNRGGWYFRVLEEAVVEAGMPVRLLERPYPKWTIARAMFAMYQGKKDAEANRELAELPVLSADWRAHFGKYIDE